jgi:hypothetical protein
LPSSDTLTGSPARGPNVSVSSFSASARDFAPRSTPSTVVPRGTSPFSAYTSTPLPASTMAAAAPAMITRVRVRTGPAAGGSAGGGSTGAACFGMATVGASSADCWDTDVT